MRKETEDIESPRRNIRDSGYIDCWDSERSDSLSPPRHGRDDSFDSLDSFGSRSQQTPSPDVVLRGSSDGRGSDSESDLPHRKMPDVKKDDMSARRTSYGEPKSVVPFNQYLPNKSNQTAYIPAPLRKKKAEREEYRKSWSTATSPLGGEKPFSKNTPETIEEEQNEVPRQHEQEHVGCMASRTNPSKSQVDFNQNEGGATGQFPSSSGKETAVHKCKDKDAEEITKLQRLEQAGIKVIPAAQRYGSQKQICEDSKPTPDIILHKQKPSVIHCQGKDSGSEDEAICRVPDLEKDDFAARRVRLNQPKIPVTFNQFSVGPYTKKDKLEGAKKSPQKENLEFVSTTTATGSFTSEKCPQICANSPQRLAVQPLNREEKEQDRQHLPDTGQDVASTVHMSNHNLDQIHPDQTSQLQEVPARNKILSSCRDELQTFGHRTAVSDDAESVSMFDMRCEDEAVMQPHSKARHEKLQHIHNQLKEDEDRWQDDLARWKSRRRSASQDLIKKEAERKKMERLLSCGDGTSERRKSIKTYREIVEEKEKREKELHEAYKNARSREEAESILQQYIERFTISEAVLERLEMPKILERSHSMEPNSSSPPKDPNPMRYLRQQSLPPPKYTAMIEATIVSTNDSETSISTGQTSPTKTVVSKAVPMLTPKPYSQPKNTQQVLKTFKVDGKVSMNGETFNGVEEKDKECTTVIFAPSLRRSPKFEGVARVDGSPMELKQDTTSIELNLKRPATQKVHRDLTASFTEEVKPINQKDGVDSGRPEMMHLGFASPVSEQKQKTTVTCAHPAIPSVEFPPSSHSEEVALKDKDLKKTETEQKEAEVLVTQKVMKSNAPEQEGIILFPFLKKIPETSQVILQNSDQQADSDNSDQSNRFSFWSWDPEEERKRQERWQHEQERLLQERYQKEQDKLKEEWEKAQKEVEEEERRYYEEERKIIEDTLVPFTVSSSSAEPLFTSSSVTEGNGTVNLVELSNSQEEDRQKEMKRQEKLPWEQEGSSLAKNKKSEPCPEKKSNVNEVPTEHPETILQWGSEQNHQASVTAHSSPALLNLPLTQDASRNQQLTKKSPHISEEVCVQKTSLDQNIGQQANSPGERRRIGCHENFRSGLSSPCSPTLQSQSPNRYQRSVSGKKLCSTCRLPLGKGAAMIIETLGLYFHIHCFRCGICKGQLGDAASGTDVRIRNGLLNCNECYIRSRTAGQPTTL
nr:LIM and calponin homology domains-containing protein 1 isoform X14 [Pelodiscus sinensis]|eukprot:XP_025043118.1 LIM and calponin homology domains-containing protein 1 isoform X14 [Pelodiscus sinensis]